MELEFTEWVRAVFDHPVDSSRNARQRHPFRKRDIGFGDIEFIAKLFDDPVPCLSGFSDGQVARGLWVLAGVSSSYSMGLFSDRFPWPLRRRFLRSVVSLYELVFARRCTAAIFCDDAVALNVICHMWWDCHRGSAGLFKPERRAVPDWRTEVEVLRALRRILAIPHDACRDAALHGLGHWHDRVPRAVERIINRFLDANLKLRPELRVYALSAREGRML